MAEPKQPTQPEVEPATVPEEAVEAEVWPDDIYLSPPPLKNPRRYRCLSPEGLAKLETAIEAKARKQGAEEERRRFAEKLRSRITDAEIDAGRQADEEIRAERNGAATELYKVLDETEGQHHSKTEDAASDERREGAEQEQERIREALRIEGVQEDIAAAIGQAERDEITAEEMADAMAAAILPDREENE